MSQSTRDIRPVYPTEPVFPLSVDQYHEMIRIGVLTDDDPVELIEGVLVFHIPKNPPHEFVIHALHDVLQKLIPGGWIIRIQSPVTLSDGEPEPDLSIVRGTLRDYLAHHPSATDTGIVMEVSDSTLDRDRGTKLRSYARAGIGEYWIINLPARRVEVYRNAHSTEPAYQDRIEYGEVDRLPVVVAGKMVGEIEVASILP